MNAFKQIYSMIIGFFVGSCWGLLLGILSELIKIRHLLER